jgi:hypothetical protein
VDVPCLSFFARQQLRDQVRAQQKEKLYAVFSRSFNCAPDQSYRPKPSSVIFHNDGWKGMKQENGKKGEKPQDI